MRYAVPSDNASHCSHCSATDARTAHCSRITRARATTADIACSSDAAADVLLHMLLLLTTDEYAPRTVTSLVTVCALTTNTGVARPRPSSS